jgi:hypothetical protein
MRANNGHFAAQYGRMGGMPRFSVKDLLRATALISLGAGLWSLPVYFPDAEVWKGEVGSDEFWMAILGGAGFIGAGVFTPFKRPWLGAALAVFALIVFTTVIMQSQ